MSRHSDADKVTVFVCEHPGFYQMSVEDNGSSASLPDETGQGEGGIGLANMKDRVQALAAQFTFCGEWFSDFTFCAETLGDCEKRRRYESCNCR